MNTAASIQLSEMLANCRSIIIGSASAEGSPDASYAPVLFSDEGVFYIYISTMARHTNNIRSSSKCSAMLIEDESEAEQLFARKRVTYLCRVEEIARNSAEWENRIAEFKAKFGEIMNTLENMLDFHLFALTPVEGRLVLGFGEAYQFRGIGLENLREIGGKGHTIKS